MTNPDDDKNGAEIPEPVRDGGRQEAAHYIMGEIEQLSAMARRHRLEMLGYLLDMALLEARDAIGRGERPPSP